MSLIEEIRNSTCYDFNKLLNTVDFDNLGDYVNVHDKNNYNLLKWMYGDEYNDNYPMIIKYIDKYYKLFNYDKVDVDNKSLLLILMEYANPTIALYILTKINFIKESIKVDSGNQNILFKINWYCNNKLDKMVNLSGILNKPYNNIIHFENNNLNIALHIIRRELFDVSGFGGRESSNNNFKNSNIMINYFGILDKISLIFNFVFVKLLLKTTIFNKIILVFGKY
jgi:hypothetical protein